jgi:hypothetical protein
VGSVVSGSGESITKKPNHTKVLSVRKSSLTKKKPQDYLRISGKPIRGRYKRNISHLDDRVDTHICE